MEFWNVKIGHMIFDDLWHSKSKYINRSRVQNSPTSKYTIMEKIKIKIICKGKEEKYLEKEIEFQGKQWEEIKDKMENFGEWINGKIIAQLKGKEKKNKVEQESIETLGKDDKQTTDKAIQKEEEERQEKKMKMVGKLMKRTKREEKEKVEKSMIELYR